MNNAENQYTFIPVGPLGTRRKIAHQKALFAGFLPLLAPGAVVAEVGPGRGEFARECLARKLEFIGFEPSAVWAEKLRAAGCRVVEETVPPLALESASVDLVHSSDFVEHLVDYRQAMKFFAESFRVLKPGGYISVIAPNYETIKALYFKYEYQHSFIVTRHRIRQMLADSGFTTLTEKCFLITLNPALNWLDRLFAHAALPVLTSAPFQSLIRGLTSDRVLFRLNKNIYDHVALLGRKPLSAADGGD